MKRAPSGARIVLVSRKFLDRLHVRCLQALIALYDFELHFLTFGQRPVAVHLDCAVVDEHVVALLALDETKALLVREPLDSALSQRSSFYTTNGGSGTEPPTPFEAAETYRHPPGNARSRRR